MKRTAMISADEVYRYGLGRQWNFEAKPVVDPKTKAETPGRLKCLLWLMFNPSTADADRDDNTIRKCVKFSAAWGFDAMLVGNLYAFRTPFPEVLKKFNGDRVGPENDARIKEMSSICPMVVLAWGTHELARPRGIEVSRILAEVPNLKVCLGLTKNGSPKHPLYISDDTKPIRVGSVNGA
jgi:hypothetical protein